MGEFGIVGSGEDVEFGSGVGVGSGKAEIATGLTNG